MRVIENQSLVSEAELENNYTSLRENQEQQGVDRDLSSPMSESHLAQVCLFESVWGH